MSRYSISRKLESGFSASVQKAREAFEGQGFEVMAELDMALAMRQWLGKALRSYALLSVCDAPLAYKALTVETEIGLLLPWHVIVYENDEGGSTVSAVDPVVATSMIESPALAIVVREIRERLERAVNAIN